MLLIETDFGFLVDYLSVKTRILLSYARYQTTGTPVIV